MRPKMILFDYGHTLLWERDFDFMSGYRAMFELVAENPGNISPEEACVLSEGIFEEADVCRKLGYEIHEFQLLRLTADLLGLKFSVPLEQVESALWTNASKGGVETLGGMVLRRQYCSGYYRCAWSGNFPCLL